MTYTADNMPSGKVFAASRYVNRISYRALTPFQLRNPAMTLMHDTLHDTWLDAHAALLRQREQQVKDAAAKLVLARQQLKRARAMTPPKEPKA